MNMPMDHNRPGAYVPSCGRIPVSLQDLESEAILQKLVYSAKLVSDTARAIESVGDVILRGSAQFTDEQQATRVRLGSLAQGLIATRFEVELNELLMCAEQIIHRKGASDDSEEKARDSVRNELGTGA